MTGYYHTVAFRVGFQDIALSYMRTTFILDGFLVGCDLASLGLTVTSSGNTLGYLSPSRFLKLSIVQKSLQGSSHLVRTFHKNSDEQALCGCKFFFNMSIVCGRRVLTASISAKWIVWRRPALYRGLFKVRRLYF